MDNKGTSAIFGVILLVAITVVLAAVIGIYSFDMGTSMPKNKNIYVQVDRINTSCITVMTVNGDDLTNLAFDSPGTPNCNSGKSGSGFYGVFNVTIDGIEISNYVPEGAPNCTSRIGSQQYFSPVPVKSQITVIANFEDGSQSVIYSNSL